ncbi:MAG: redoxin domain-containing protein [Pseudohongiellaceae bacterium]
MQVSKVFSRLTKATIAALLMLGVSLSASAGERISDFSLVDADGRFFQLSRHSDAPAIVLVAYDKDSRDARRAVADLADIAAEFKPVEFLVINATNLADKSVMREEAAARNIAFRILMDDTQLVSRDLGLTRAGEAVIIDPGSMEVLYRGALNSRQAAGSRSERRAATYVADTLNAMLANQKLPDNVLASKGDELAYNLHESISYADDIAPILEQRCVSCHQEGGIAPFAMDSHQMVRGWSPMMREALITKRMPPGQIGREFVHDFHDVNHITIEETRKLVQWIDQKSPNTNDSDPLASFDAQPVKWLGGEPDMVIPIPAQKIPATGVQDYRNIRLPLELEEDIWVKAVEFEAGDPTVLHHIIAFSYGPNGVNEFEILNQGIGLGAYAPGNELNLYPEGAGYPLKKGGGLMLQLHYTTSGKEAVDASEIGLYLWDEKPERVVLGGSAADLDIDIAPHSTKEMVASKTFHTDSYLTMLGPHMHYRGYDANFVLRFPDGREQEVLNVPNYQFNWQKTYDFKEPMFLPAGTELVFRGTFDNTENNPFNPDASQTLSWGEQTWQEMFFGFFRYVEADDDVGGQ